MPPNLKRQRIIPPTPSLYSLVPTPESLALGSSAQSDASVIRQLTSLLDIGIAATILDGVVTKEEQLKKRAEREVGRRLRRAAGGASGVESSADEGADWSAGEGSRRRTRSTQTGRLVKKRKVEEDERILAGLDVAETSPPSFYPSGDLLASIHSHAAQRYSITRQLLPPLTPDSPFLPLEAIEHIAQIKLRAEEAEEEAARDTSKGFFNRYKTSVKDRKRLGDPGWKKAVFSNVERGLDSSALVALGVLLNLLVADACFDPALHPTREQELSALKERALRQVIEESGLARREWERVAVGEDVVLPVQAERETRGDDGAGAGTAKRGFGSDHAEDEEEDSLAPHLPAHLDSPADYSTADADDEDDGADTPMAVDSGVE